MKLGIATGVCLLVLLVCTAQAQCLGDCYKEPDCSGTPIIEGVQCYVCEEQGLWWKPYPTVECFCDEETLNNLYPLCLFHCPECSDAIDNDADSFIDFPDDPECCGGIDNSELEYCCQPIPELLTLALVGIGVGLIVWRKR